MIHLDDLREQVDLYGWAVVNVPAQQERPAWSYSVGFQETFSHPEVLLVGLPIEILQSAITRIGESIRSGNVFGEEGDYLGIIDRKSCCFRAVNERWLSQLAPGVQAFYGARGCAVLQCFWPDPNGLFPWESGCSSELVLEQPCLFSADPDEAGIEALIDRTE